MFVTFANLIEGKLEKLVTICGLLIIVLALLRWWINYKYTKTQKITKTFWNLLLIVICLNALMFSLVLCMIGWAHEFSGHIFIVFALIVSGLTTASPITLGAVRNIQKLFLAIILVPFIIVLLFYNYPTLSNSTYFLIPFVIVGMYSTLQGRIYHKHIVQEYLADLKVKETNKNLLEQTAMMQHSSRLSSLGEMASGLSHEINNPLTIMLGHIDILLQVPKSKEEQKEILIKIRQSGQRIAKIIRALRTFSRQSDQDPKKLVPIQQIIDSTLEFCEQRFAVEGVSIEIKIADDLQVYCREIHISQVLVNLLNNAFDESLRSNASVIRVNCFRDEQSVKIEVINKGVISKDSEEKIFQPFFTTKDVGKGTGLGLNISRRIAIEHGGSLKFENSDGEVKFTLSIPVNEVSS
jgi:signal transduction histidine kinase